MWKIDGSGLSGRSIGRIGGACCVRRGHGASSVMRGFFSQIVIGIIVTVVGTVIANALVGSGRGGSHFMSGVHMSGPGRR